MAKVTEVLAMIGFCLLGLIGLPFIVYRLLKADNRKEFVDSIPHFLYSMGTLVFCGSIGLLGALWNFIADKKEEYYIG